MPEYGWMNDPNGWNGSMTLPRELSLENGKLLQKPYQKIEKDDSSS